MTGLELFCVLMWCVWGNRNAATHDGKVKAPLAVLDYSTSFLAEFKSAHVHLSPSGASSTPPPPPNCLKINTDAAVRSSSSFIDIGAVIRNESGWVVGAISKPFPSNCSAEIGQFIALCEGLLFASSLQLHIRFAEVDASSVASRISSALSVSDSVWNDDVVNVVCDILPLCKALGIGFCSHTPRKGNEAAHLLASLALKSGSVRIWLNASPCFLSTLS